jgi:hypothetical protein
MLRKLPYCIVAGLVVVAFLHFWPDTSDSFDLVQSNGQILKVFRRGWPITYVREGPFREGGVPIAAKIVANFLIYSVAFVGCVYAFERFWSRRQGKA